jgi:hypothetical protein
LALEAGKEKRKQLAKDTGEERERLSHLAHIASRYEKPRRRGLLSFEHHVVVAAQKDREDWLRYAEENKWSKQKLREELRSAINAKKDEERRRQEEATRTPEPPPSTPSSPATTTTPPAAAPPPPPKQREWVTLTTVSFMTHCPDCGAEFLATESMEHAEVTTDSFWKGEVNDGREAEPVGDGAGRAD